MTTKRPWFTQTMSSSAPFVVTDSYLSTNGSLVVAVTKKMLDANGKALGVVGVDISLEGLSKKVAEFNFGKTGHFIRFLLANII